MEGIKAMKGFPMKRALLDFVQDALALVAVSIFVVAATYGSAGISALIILARTGQ